MNPIKCRRARSVQAGMQVGKCSLQIIAYLHCLPSASTDQPSSKDNVHACTSSSSEVLRQWVVDRDSLDAVPALACHVWHPGWCQMLR